MSISYVLISCEMGDEESVMIDLEKIDSVKEVTRVMGSYDVIVKLEEPSSDDLKKTISSKIRTIDKIRTTLTLPVIQSQE
ncbi:Regulatory protein AsnC [Marine Group I thaumarchaeote SCGC AAA799-E16]|uniref:Regulatory protein AsnC n=4 Tax=Marine Group I TaxID=905826 RepID=A0A081RLA1_9ARCH|nr:Regulatory protein AsnC [Marine Group I thaumarchaeote SCGC AAA799-N04]KER05552.1 Regulatory protein AsnC [Marine Group I thaumarchaeote SCGC AAA799-E16]KFM15613.1 Regulatory protein AsnC [Marine Group I thaumarchaeote SCGC AAA799-D11]KFM15776.1 putative homocitrate synthase protein [Marine Group I thaumarchaeote SCGC RSA3]